MCFGFTVVTFTAKSRCFVDIMADKEPVPEAGNESMQQEEEGPLEPAAEERTGGVFTIFLLSGIYNLLSHFNFKQVKHFYTCVSGSETRRHRALILHIMPVFRLRTASTGHCQLLSHLYRLKIPHADECPYGTGPQTPSNILQSCPTFVTLRRQAWPSAMDLREIWDRWGRCGGRRTLP